MQTHSNWKNYLKILFVPILSLLAMAWALQSFAKLDTKGEFYVIDEIKAPAPGQPDKIGSISEAEFLRWSYLVSPVAPQDELDPEEGAKVFLEEIESKAHKQAATKPADLADPAKKAKYEETLSQLLSAEMRKKVPGPFQRIVWDWYRRELAYERGHAAEVAALAAKQKEWMAAYVATQKFNAENAAEIEKRSQERANFIANPDVSLQPSVLEVESATKAAVLGVTWDRQNAAVIKAFNDKKSAAVAALTKQLLENPASASDAEWKAAEAAHAAALAELKATPFLRPENYRAIQAMKGIQLADDAKRKASEAACPAKDCKENDFAIQVDVETSLNQTLDLESQANSGLQKNSTVGFDGYSIIEAPLESVAAAFQIRNGVPVRADELGWKKSVIFPVDKLFKYRREMSQDMSDLWGPGAYFNASIKADSTTSFVNALSDAYFILVRGNKQDGYDLFFQLLGKACFPELKQDIGNCVSETQSNFAILMLRPLEGGRTAFKMSGRYVGQTYKMLPHGRAFVGFNVEKFVKGQFEFNEQARRTAAALAELRAGKEVIHVSSEAGYYFEQGKLVKLDANAKPTKKQYPITLQQNFYLVDGKLIQLTDDRGSRDYGGVAMQNFPINDL